MSLHSSIKALPTKITTQVTGLGTVDHALLSRKERWLRSYKIAIPNEVSSLRTELQATLVFAQEESGTAVCISPNGFLLTCSHCIAESAEDLDKEKSHWLLFAFGRVVETKCVAWDPQRDLAILRIVAAQLLPTILPSDKNRLSPSYPYVQLATSAPVLEADLACIGHPGSKDLETEVVGTKTDYDILHVSTGAFHGYIEGQDLQDNSEIGALQHDCWTYWGHSGAPLIEQATRHLVGLHSSWDDESGMRRGVPLEALREFLSEHQRLLEDL